MAARGDAPGARTRVHAGNVGREEHARRAERAAPAQIASYAALGPGATEVTRSITIARPRSEVFRALRAPSTLARIASGMRQVAALSSTADRVRWVLRGKLGMTLPIVAEIAAIIPDEMLAFRSPPGARVAAAGTVQLTDTPADRGTVVRVTFAHVTPGGILGRLAERVLLPGPGEIVRGALRRLQQLVETGEIATIEGQPSGRTGG